jgi:hypothetical protein
MTRALVIVDEVASRQWSLVTRQQLTDLKVSNTTIKGLLDAGTLRRVGYRVYAVLGSPKSWEQSVMAEVLAAGEGAVASHSPAARLWDYCYLPEDAFDVTILASPGEGVRRRNVHRTKILPAADVSEVRGIPCTSFERTLCDCTAGLSPFQVGRVLDDGLRRSVVSLDRLMRCAARLDSGPGRRLSVIQRLLAERDASFDPGGSASELRVMAVLRDADIPAPVQQFRVKVGSRRFVLDFAWPDQLVFAEFYGLAVHSGASAVASDSSRLTALVAAGWRPLVFTDSTPDHEIVQSVQTLLSSAQSDWALSRPQGA